MIVVLRTLAAALVAFTLAIAFGKTGPSDLLVDGGAILTCSADNCD